LYTNPNAKKPVILLSFFRIISFLLVAIKKFKESEDYKVI
jgi:hypothetical protein